MGARRVFGDFGLGEPFPVLTAQAVEQYDLVTLSANNIIRAQDVAWGTAVAAPSAPTAADGGVAFGTGLTNAATAIKISYQFPWGEGALSAAASATPTANAAIKLSGAPLTPGTNALWTNIYVETAAASGVFQFYGTTTGQNVMILGYGNGRVPPTAVASGALEATQFAFNQTFAGCSNQRKIAALARIFGNSLDNVIMVGKSGTYEFDCAAATFNYGDFVAPAKDTGNNLLNQTVIKTAGPALGIGRVARTYLSNTTKVEVEIKSAIQPSAPNLYGAKGTATGGVQ